MREKTALARHRVETAQPAAPPSMLPPAPSKVPAPPAPAALPAPVAQLLDEALDLAHHCIRCGFCLPACPTYRETLLETESPRGRIALVRAVAEGVLPVADVVGPIDRCIGCRACEVACPAGVHYGAILERARAVVETTYRRSLVERWVRAVGLRWVLSSPQGIRWGGLLVNWYARSGLRGLVHRLNLVRRLAPRLAEAEAALPLGAGLRTPRVQPARSPAAAPRAARAPRVAFFVGCVQSMAFSHVNAAAIRVLEAGGCTVITPDGQGCCGAVHAHAGERAAALAQARRNIAAFERVDADVVVSVAGGCGAALKEYPEWLAGESQWAERARRFSARVRDFTELVAELALPAMGPVAGVVTYQDSCHLRNVQKVSDPPRALLRRIPGLRYVELPEADICCGAGGIYNLTQPAMSRHILDRKMEKVRETGATVLAVANTPCHLQMLIGARRSGLDKERGLEVRHVAELLDEALRQAPQGQPGGSLHREVRPSHRPEPADTPPSSGRPPEG